MRTPSITRFYQVQHGSEWARFWVTDDGCLSIISDFGNYGYWWHSPGVEFRAFLASDRGSPDYIGAKLHSGQRDWLYAHDTERAIKRKIISLRRDRLWSAGQARAEWDLASIDDEAACWHWYYNTQIEDAHELPVHGPSRQLVAFM